MSIWTGIKHAINSTLGTTNFKPLDVIFDEKTKVNIQNIVFTLQSAGASSGADRKSKVTINPINTSKSILIPTSIAVNDPGTSAITFSFNSTSATCTAHKVSGSAANSMTISACIIEFAN